MGQQAQRTKESEDVAARIKGVVLSMTIYRVSNSAAFAEAPEIFAGVQLGKMGTQYLLVLGCRVAVAFDDRTFSNLEEFYSSTWGGARRSQGKNSGRDCWAI